MSLKPKLILLFVTYMIGVNAQESDIPQGLVPPLYLNPSPESTLEQRLGRESDGSSGNSNSCGACGS